MPNIGKNKVLKNWLNPNIDRRKFLKVSSALASASAVAPALLKSKKAEGTTYGENSPDTVETDSSVEIKYTVCKVCHGGCGVRVKIKDGIVIKLDGNPYHPNCMEPEEQLAFSTPVEDAKKTPGRLCAKGPYMTHIG